MLSRVRSRIDRRLRRGDESGFTLVEMMIASSVVVIIFVTMTGTIAIFGKAETSTVNSTNSASNTRLALLQLQHDIQSANPLGTLPVTSPVTAYDDWLQLTIQPSNVVVTWQYSSTTNQLTRQVGSAAAVAELTGVINGSTPVFSYYDHCAINLVTESGATVSSVSSDATVVQVSLSLANFNSAPYGTTTKVNIMNQPPGASRCG
jgi:prepilin-type N-terminal cleavage/methylation domain-containing protein